jgi:hypothetical protein
LGLHRIRVQLRLTPEILAQIDILVTVGVAGVLHDNQLRVGKLDLGFFTDFAVKRLLGRLTYLDVATR